MHKITYRSPANIALVKYWGKKKPQLPMNPSISMSLKNSYTETTIEPVGKTTTGISLNFVFEGKENKAFAQRIESFLSSVLPYFPFLVDYHLNISSSNSFPHSSGIASSASAMSALAMCLVRLEQQLDEPNGVFETPEQKASFIARLGSGSAARSIYGGYTLWGETPSYAKSFDEYAVDINASVHPVFQEYKDAILLVSQGVKKVSSTVGHSLMNNHPFAERRFRQAQDNITKLFSILEHGNQKAFVDIVEEEALSLHAMMMTSSPSFILMAPNTLHVIEKIREFRENTGIPACFTLDAGANVHFLYPGEHTATVEQFIQSELSPYCQDGKYILDEIGEGPEFLLNA